jgi:hypothetical protein
LFAATSRESSGPIFVTAAPQAWADRIPGAEAILLMERNEQRTEKLSPSNQAITLHIVKNRGGDCRKLVFEFFPPFSRFGEMASSEQR